MAVTTAALNTPKVLYLSAASAAALATAVNTQVNTLMQRLVLPGTGTGSPKNVLNGSISIIPTASAYLGESTASVFVGGVMWTETVDAT